MSNRLVNRNRFVSAGLPLVCLLFFVLAGCKGSSRLAPIDQLDQPPAIKISQHRVSKGDTLYSIAWRYGMDYRQIAQLNNIQSPYTIYVGQKLDLGQKQRGSTDRYDDAAATQVVAVPDSGYASGGGVKEVGNVKEISGVREISSAPVSVETRTSEAPSARVMTPDSAVVPVSPPEPMKDSASAPSPVNGQWLWPVKGRLIGRFSSDNPLQKGIDIEGADGTPVKAAAAGNVVYAGNGLAGYGELVIVKHNETFLSAYAHNRKLLVVEGAQVQSGQTIAEMGSSGTDKTKLHFEIRQAGKPVDPLLFLPKP